jgi:hypothetical protein
VDLSDLSALLDNAKRSAFRLETLPQYLVPQEEAKLAAWRRGERIRRTPENNAWLAELKQIVAGGIRWYRVHILDYPLCEYSQFELYSYQDSAAVGQETFIADRAEHDELRDLHEDFWLVDGEVAVRMVYDDEGHFLRPEPIEDVRPYLAVRDTAMQCAAPLMEYLAQREPELIA